MSLTTPLMKLKTTPTMSPQRLPVLESLSTAKNDLEDVEESQSDKPEGEADATGLGQSPDDAPPSIHSLSGVPELLLSQDTLKHKRNDDRCLGLPDGSRCSLSSSITRN